MIVDIWDKMNRAEAWKIERSSNDLDELLDVGAWYHENGEFNRAARTYEKIAKFFPDQKEDASILSKKMRKLAREINS